MELIKLHEVMFLAEDAISPIFHVEVCKVEIVNTLSVFDGEEGTTFLALFGLLTLSLSEVDEDFVMDALFWVGVLNDLFNT